jgi:chromosomal replication initiator protein
MMEQYNSLVEYVASLFDCSATDIYSHSRRRNVVDARKICMSACHEFTDASLPDIGKYFNHDRTTVLYSIRKAKDYYKNERVFRALMDHVYDKCHNHEIDMPFRVAPYRTPPAGGMLTDEECHIIQLT